MKPKKETTKPKKETTKPKKETPKSKTNQINEEDCCINSCSFKQVRLR